MLNNICKTLKKYNLINKGDKILIGVSGGPDSVALLYGLYALRKELGLSLCIAHLDHGLRSDSGKDRKFVELLAAKLKIPVISAKVKLAKRGSIEELARNARFDFLIRTAKKIRADKIALGHNLDDQAETVLMRILRGTGLYGLSAILPKRKIYGVTFIRPLIETKRKEIEAFLKKKGVQPRFDATNAQDLYLRNRIRNNLLPALEKDYNKNIKEALANLAQSAGSDYDYLNNLAAKKFGAKIPLAKLRKLHSALQRLSLRSAIYKVKGDTRRITFAHILELEDLILNRPVNSIVDLPGGVSAAKKKAVLIFYKRA